MSNPESKLLAAGNSLGVLFLAFFVAMGGTLLYQNRNWTPPAIEPTFTNLPFLPQT